MTTETVFKARDGKTFTDERDARQHEGLLNVRGLLENDGVCAGGEWSVEAVAAAVFEERALLMAIFSVSDGGLDGGEDQLEVDIAIANGRIK